MSRDDFRRRADVVRAIPLEVVLTSWGAVRDRRDQSRWHTRRGPLSVTGTQFFNWHTHQGGGGAIDLVMHLGGWDARPAIEWLASHLGGQVAGTPPKTYTKDDVTPASRAAPPSNSASSSNGRDALTNRSDEDSTRCSRHQQLRLPTSSSANLQRVRRYLVEQRALAATILDPLMNAGTVYADRRGNAVFLMVTGKPNRPIGAELRGTGNRLWRGLAPGTCKNAGYFWIGHTGSKRIILCESAIDAISCFQLRTQHDDAQRAAECICISTAGVRPDAPWLRPLLSRGYGIYCGFDADEPGESASRRLITRHSSIHRLRPPAHDWNDALIARCR